MCPNCRAFISSSDRVCPYCDTKLGPPAIEQRAPSDLLGGLIPGSRFTTSILLLLNLGIYGVCTVYAMAGDSGIPTSLDGNTLYRFGAKENYAILQGGQWWRLITAGFLHGGLLHFLMNTYILFDVGAQVEEFYGSARYLVIYVLSTIGGFLASTFFSPALSVGASAGLFGLIACMIVLGIKLKSQTGEALRSHYTRWAIWGVAVGLLPGFRIDNAAHLGGFVTGFVVAWIADTPKLVDNWREKLWRVLAGFCVALVGFAFLQMILQFNASS
ncbi:MAG TPA: rhomboid family intramembrane serine protease [Bryobacteraceae bacterium]|nr:rhomboid family intramembrane serine protease [Bryobacteraceae bacterium]